MSYHVNWFKPETVLPPERLPVLVVCAGTIYRGHWTKARGWRIDGQDDLEADVKKWEYLPEVPFT